MAKKSKKLEFYGGEIIWKSHSEHYTERQFLYGSPLNYLKQYTDYDTREESYVLWQFNIETLSYEVLDSGGKDDYRRLRDLGTKLEDDRREAHHVNELRKTPRDFWRAHDIEKYGDILPVYNYEDDLKN
jgi:hypothetical protein